MEQRINFLEKGKDVMKVLYGIRTHLNKSGFEPGLLNLIIFRVSQINGCAYCLDMHSKDLRAQGESEQRLYLLNAWREAPFYNDRERAALAWAEAVTTIPNGNISDEVYEKVCKQFSEKEIIDLTLAINTINTYNRFNIAFRTTAGSYEVGAYN